MRKVLSHPLRVRGLKLAFRSNRAQVENVASFTGAWIETQESKEASSEADQSHPLRVRGLKQKLEPDQMSGWVSRILYGCVD